ncbi:MAG: carbon monoxide dehydrogenase subunit G [Burkholderiales bacterium]
MATTPAPQVELLQTDADTRAAGPVHDRVGDPLQREIRIAVAKMSMVAVVGPVKAKFAGKLKLGDLNPPDSYALAFEGSGDGAGFDKGGAELTLSPEGPGTKLAYVANATVGGKLAQVRSRLIDGIAKKMACDFFRKFATTIAPAPVEEVGAVHAAFELPRAAEPALNPIWIVAGVIVAEVILCFLLGGR